MCSSGSADAKTVHTFCLCSLSGFTASYGEVLHHIYAIFLSAHLAVLNVINYTAVTSRINWSGHLEYDTIKQEPDICNNKDCTYEYLYHTRIRSGSVLVMCVFRCRISRVLLFLV